jgi:hypothetical protein
MFVCPVALFADALLWCARAGIVLTVRMTTAVALAATAFSIAILIAENAEAIRGVVGAQSAILSEVIAQPVLADTSAPIRVALIHN